MNRWLYGLIVFIAGSAMMPFLPETPIGLDIALWIVAMAVLLRPLNLFPKTEMHHVLLGAILSAWMKLVSRTYGLKDATPLWVIPLALGLALAAVIYGIRRPRDIAGTH